MTEYVPHADDEPDWVVIAQAEGIVAARDHTGITEAAIALRTRARTLGVPIEQLAQDLVRARRHGSSNDA
jgi:AmiR/NasT family two-component response regulator